MTSQEIRQQFIDFFKDKNHTFVPSAPVVPQDDPTLLFANAGMNQFKDVFLNKGSRPYTRAVNSQKCIRVSGKHNDLEEVGHDTYHHTFFEMLGNWSFGDYYKEEAIQWAWELLTEVWKLPKDKLYATVYKTDNEAADLWAEKTDIKKEHILYFAEKDNFWEMGATGPCGPCSEVHIDLGSEHCDKQDIDHVCAVNGECGRYIELWNLVFIQYNRDEQGALHPLPNKHVDTGAGFERLVAVLQNAESNYSTDVFIPILENISVLSGEPYSSSEQKSSFHVIADHVRMLTFSIADGGVPSNDGRGYVMRRILRRAARYGRTLNMHEPFIYKLVPTVVEIMSAAFPELLKRKEHVMTVIQAEEEHFNRTLDRGLEIFAGIKNNLQAKNRIIIPGEEVFKLYDTYGFPIDLTRILAEEEGLSIDHKGFEEKMEAQRLRARAASKFSSEHIADDDWIIINEGIDSIFLGYDELAIETHLMRYYAAESEIQVVLRETPFYAESGGQVGDHGNLSIDNYELEVFDTQKDGDHIIHRCTRIDGFEPKSEKVLAEVTQKIRKNTARNHSATHLLHAALRKILGDHITQAGSLVDADHLRFDFTHYEKISRDQIQHIELAVNHKIQENIKLKIAEEKYKDAKARGAMALFGEKYGDVVRTVTIPGYSLELCGGTHIKSTGEIGPFVILSESSIASGVRRIDAISGFKAVRHIQDSLQILQTVSSTLNSSEKNTVQKLKELITRKKELEKELEKASSANLQSNLQHILAESPEINGIKLFIYRATEANLNQLKELGDTIREQSENLVGLITNLNGDKINFVCIVTDDLIKSGRFKAGDLVREVATTAGGGGGGRPHLATAGAKDVTKMDDAIRHFEEIVKKKIES